MSRNLILVAAIGAAAWIASTAASSRAKGVTTRVDIAKNEIGTPPADFEFLRTGEGELGQWTVVRDPTAVAGVAIEQLSKDPTEHRFPLAIFKPLFLKNVSVRARFKLIEGMMKTAGIAVRFQNIDNYYVASASALEGRVDLFRFVHGKKERIGGTDAEVIVNHWHMLGLVAREDKFTVSLDDVPLFMMWDHTFLMGGRIGLWAEEDNLTRFDQLEITVLPRSEEER